MASEAPARVSEVFFFKAVQLAIPFGRYVCRNTMKLQLKTYSLLLLCLLLLVGNANAQSDKRAKYNKQFNHVLGYEAAVADIDQFYAALNAGHPDLYRYVTRKQFDAMVADLKTRASQLTVRELYNELSRLATQIGCGHLVLDYPKKLDKYFKKYVYYLPLHVELHDGNLVVLKSYIDTVKLENTVVRSINGMPIDSVLDSFNQYITHDGYNTSSNTWLLENGWFNDFYTRFWPDSSSYTYEIEQFTDDGYVTKMVTLPGFDYKTMKLPRKKRHKPEPQLLLEYEEDTRTAILTFKTFDPQAIAQGKQQFHKFVRNAFFRIAQLAPEQLIIDLRGNEGGNSFYPETLIGYLSTEPYHLYRNMEIAYRSMNSKEQLLKIKGKKSYKRLEKHGIPSRNGNLSMGLFTDKLAAKNPLAYQGTVYVMVDGGTYSAASELACYLKEHMEAIVVGSETGGSCDPITAGLYGDVELENSGIVVHIPLIAFDKDIQKPRIPGRGLMPDIEQHLRATDSIADPELEQLLDLIEGQSVE